MSNELKPPTAKLSIDESDPIYKWRLRSANLMKQESKKEDIIQRILNETEEDDSEFKKKNSPKNKKSLDFQASSTSQRDFEAFISKQKEIIQNMKAYNEAIKSSELNINILSAKTNLQNRLNELTLSREFKNEERENIKIRLSQIAQLENEIARKRGSRNGDNLGSLNSLENLSVSERNEGYTIAITGPSEKQIFEKNEKNEDYMKHERESNISLTSFLDHKKGIGKINQLFKQEFEEKERKLTEDGNFNLNDYNIKTIDGKKAKNSRKLYELKYKNLASNYAFREKPKIVLKLADQLYQCYSCHRSIQRSFFFFWNTARFCHYSGFWHCVDCISLEKKPIPYKALEDFDLRSYSVSLDSQKEMDYLYKKAILLVDYQNPIVKNNKKLYDFLVLKRQIHLIYDMICNPGLVQELMQDKINLVLKENLFSLENLLDIYNGALSKIVTKCINLLARHIDHCMECQLKGVICKLCNSENRIFVFDMMNTTLCPNCKRLYHSVCLQSKVCIYCVHDT